MSDFHLSLKQDVAIRAQSTGDYSDSAFAQVVTEHLLESGSLNEFLPCTFRQKGMKVDGYAFVDHEATLDLFVVDYANEKAPSKFTRKDLEQGFKRLETFFEKCLSNRFLEGLEVSHAAYPLARRIFDDEYLIARVRFFLITDSILSDRVKGLPSRDQSGREWSYQVWDLDRIEKVMATGEPEEIVVDFVETFGAGLKCLPAGLENADLQCYLAVLPGDWLARIYGSWSGRLLEQNVRTFLQLKGGVNKGIRDTILHEPQNFFPFNNGISTTAAHAEIVENHGTLEIRKLRNFQIVNGGQTTVSLYRAMKLDKDARIEDVSVQMKLTVVSSDRVIDLVPKISKFSNSQNKITDADFFSTHPFHVRLETISRRIPVPPRPGVLAQTHWFYERARGQYASEQMFLSATQKLEFQVRYPKGSVLCKTDIATHFNTFKMLPHLVRKGTEKNFASFTKFVAEVWAKDDKQFNDAWFQEAVARSILFRATEKAVSEAPWYAPWGYRSTIVTYAISLLVYSLSISGRSLDLKKVWIAQEAGPAFKTQIAIIGELVQTALTEGAVRAKKSNPQEWGKDAQCWDVIKGLEFPEVPGLAWELATTGDDGLARRDQKRDQQTSREVTVKARGETRIQPPARAPIVAPPPSVPKLAGTVQVGDLVACCYLDAPDDFLEFLIVEGAGKPELGKVNVSTPLGKALLGLELGQTGDLLVAGHVLRRLKVTGLLKG